MYLFARNGTAAPDRLFEATAFAIEIAAKASSIAGVEIAAWRTEYGGPLTGLGWTVVHESHAAAGAVGEKLLADAGYVEAVQAAAPLFTGPGEDILAQIVASGGNGGHRGEYSSIVMAQCAAGKIGQAMAYGVEMMNDVVRITGRDSIFTRSMYGPWASVAWFSLAASLDEVEAATAALSADPDHLGKLDAGGGLFLPGSGESRLTRRIG